MTTNAPWRYRINTFASNTATSNVKMLSLATDTHAKLKAEEASPAIAAILLVYEPVFFAYRDLDQQYGVKAGEYQGKTLGFEEYMEQMPLKLRQWESIIRAVYIEDSPEEKAIFPNKRSPFFEGTYESRLDALGALKIKTTADAALATAAAQITSFYNAALGARLAQQTDEGALGQLSDLRENQRILLSEELMGVLGQLLFIYRHNLEEVERYFDLSLLRETGETEPVIKQGEIGGGQVVNINSMGVNLQKLGKDTVVKLRNISATPIILVFYSAQNPADNPGPGPQFDVASGATLEKVLGDFDIDNYNNLNIYNPAAVTGSWQIEIVT